MPSTSELPSLVLVCPSNCGSLHLDVQHAGEPLADVLAGEGEVLLLEEVAPLGHVVDGAGQRRLEPGEVGTALVGVDVVHEGEGVLVVPILVLQGDVHVHVVLDGGEGDRLGMERLLVPVEPLDELDQAALGEEGLALGRLLPLILDGDRDAPVEERELPQPVGQGGVVELEDREDLRIRLEPNRRARALGLAQDVELLDRLAPHEPHVVPLPVAVDDDLQPLAERVHHRHADAVQPAGHLVGVLVELPARVEHGQRHFDRRLLLRRVHVHRDAAAVVGDGDRVVGVNGHVDGVAVTRQRLVDRVVHHLVDQVMQAVLTGGPDVHAGPPAYRLQSLEDLNRFRFVLGLTVQDGARFFGHVLCSLGLIPVQRTGRPADLLHSSLTGRR